MTDPRRVHFPLKKVEECFTCQKAGEKLFFCSSCWGRVYCSSECQSLDWKEGNHKKACVKVEQVDIETLHGYLACLCHEHRIMAQNIEGTLHPAMTHRIVNNPAPGICEPEPIPGSENPEDQAVHIKLGSKLGPEELDSLTWWPKCASQPERLRLLRRIVFDGYDFHLHWIATFAFLWLFYTDRSKWRLKLKNSPVADFGLAHGKIDIDNKDRLVYILEDGSVQRGQDPKDHWWIYVRNARGDEAILDYGAYTWNAGPMVSSAPYKGLEQLRVGPGVFQARDADSTANPSTLHYAEDDRFSILEDEVFGNAINRISAWEALPDICAWLEARFKFKKPISDLEKQVAQLWLERTFMNLTFAVVEGDWKQWPSPPTVADEGGTLP